MTDQTPTSSRDVAPLKPLSDENCACCGRSLDVQPGQSFVASTDGRVWHYGCAPSARIPPPASEELVEALTDARAAIASLPEDALGMAMVPASGEGGNGYAYPIRDELLAKIDAAIEREGTPRDE